MAVHIKTYKLWTIVITELGNGWLQSDIFIGLDKMNCSMSWKYSGLQQIFKECISCCDNLQAFPQLRGNQ